MDAPNSSYPYVLDFLIGSARQVLPDANPLSDGGAFKLPDLREYVLHPLLEACLPKEGGVLDVSQDCRLAVYMLLRPS